LNSFDDLTRLGIVFEELADAGPWLFTLGGSIPRSTFTSSTKGGTRLAPLNKISARAISQTSAFSSRRRPDSAMVLYLRTSTTSRLRAVASPTGGSRSLCVRLWAGLRKYHLFFCLAFQRMCCKSGIEEVLVVWCRVQTPAALFKWRHFEPVIIVCAVRWYSRYSSRIVTSRNL